MHAHPFELSFSTVDAAKTVQGDGLHSSPVHVAAAACLHFTLVCQECRLDCQRALQSLLRDTLLLTAVDEHTSELVRCLSVCLQQSIMLSVSPYADDSEVVQTHTPLKSTA